MAISIKLLDRLKALENRTHLAGDILVFEDGHTAKGNLFDAIKSFAAGGPRIPYENIVGFQSEGDESGLYQAIFRAVKDSEAKQ